MDKLISEVLMCAYFVTRIGAENVIAASLYIMCNSTLEPLNVTCQSRHAIRSPITRSPSDLGYNVLQPRLIHFPGQCSSGVSITSSAKTRDNH
jgi:hypothetical protein